MLTAHVRLLRTSFRVIATLSAIALGGSPIADQLIDGQRVPVESSTFLGGSSHELGASIKVDVAGNAYIVGTTQSPDFPTSPGAFRRTGAPSNLSEVFVSKLNPAGTALVYSTFLGGRGSEAATGITPDATGNLTFNGGADAFAAELSADGSSLLYSTYIGGTQSEGVDELALLLSPANGDTPSQAISCDWSDVPGATSYMIEVDDVSGFTAPPVRDVSVAPSQYVTSGLAATQQFWRVRAVNSAGVAGAWSVIRSF